MPAIPKSDGSRKPTGPRAETHIRIDRAKLLLELNRRGLTAADFAKLAKLSAPTMSRLLGGAAVSPGTARQIAETLQKVHPIDGLDGLLVSA